MRFLDKGVTTTYPVIVWGLVADRPVALFRPVAIRGRVMDGISRQGSGQRPVVFAVTGKGKTCLKAFVVISEEAHLDNVDNAARAASDLFLGLHCSGSR